MKHLSRLFLLFFCTLFTCTNSAFAAPVQGTPTGPPQAVYGISVTKNSDDPTIVTVSWSALSTALETGGGTIQGYAAVAVSRDVSNNYTVITSASCAVAGTLLTCQLTGLNFATYYKIRMTATNEVGTSIASYSAEFQTNSMSQSITWDPPPGDKSYGDPDFNLSATATPSNLKVSWTTSTSSVCTVDSSGIVHILAVGTCTITASQSGGSGYGPATPVTKSFQVGTSYSVSLSGVSSITGSSATLRGLVGYPGSSVSPRFCLSLADDTSACSIAVTTSPATITVSSSPTVTGAATGLTPGATYYYWLEASTAKSTTLNFQTLSTPVITYTGPSTGTVGTAFTGTATITGGTGIYALISATNIPDGLTLTPDVSSGQLAGTPTSANSFNVVFYVSDSGGQAANPVTVHIVISAAATPPPGGGGSGGGGSGGGGSPTPTPVTPAGPSSQTITVSNTTTSVYYGDPDMQLIASASSGLPIAYVTTSPTVCSITASGLIKFLAIGQCLIALSQSGSTSFSATTKSISIEVLPKLSVVLEEFTNVQSSSATAVATAPWPGSDATIKFCVSLTNSKKDCATPTGIDIATATPTLITKDSSSVVTSDISGLAPGTDYFVWAVETLGAQSATSEIRKIHTPVGPTILYSGSINYTNSEPIRVQFRATGGSGGYKNWKADGLPTGAVQSPSTGTFTVTGNNLKSGTYIVTVTVQDKSGSPGSITIVLTITGGVTSGQPTPVQGATTQLASATSVEITWNKQNDAVQYVATLGTQTLCTTSTTSCVVPQLLGPKSQITVTAVGTNGVKSQAVPTLYKAPVAAIDLTVVNFALNSAVLDAKSKAKIATWAKTLQAQGFTALQVSGHTDSTGNNKINTPLSKARATNTFKYLKQILAKTPISVTLLAEGASSPVQSNKTAEGRAANRRAVVSIR